MMFFMMIFFIVFVIILTKIFISILTQYGIIISLIFISALLLPVAMWNKTRNNNKPKWKNNKKHKSKLHKK